jgi:ABC-type bacteriocin/lantibiotic exporter with double-glycine peptidase domain
VWLVSGACSSTASIQASNGAPGINGWYVSGVPFYPQLAYQCGPASLAAVLNYWGGRVTPDEIATAIYSPRLKGTLSLDMWQYARAQQFQADMRSGSLEDLEALVHANIPVIAFLNLGYDWLPGGHFVVVVGLDPEKGSVITYSGKEQNSRIPYDRFLKAWRKTNFWTLVVRPKSEA